MPQRREQKDMTTHKTYSLSKFEWRVGQMLGYTDEARFAFLVNWAESHGYNADWSEFSDADFIEWHDDFISEVPSSPISAATKNELAVAAHRINTDSDARKQMLALMNTPKAGA
jgi:hypothetical protein